jgi:hypothetical protein
LERHSAWTASVYQALAGERATPEEESRIAIAMRDMRLEEDREIGEAFAAAIRSLPRSFRDWRGLFANVPPAPLDYRAHLADQLVVIAAGRYGNELIEYGMTPATFHGAARGIQLVAARMIRLDSKEAARDFVLLGSQRMPTDHKPEMTISYEVLLSQIRGAPSCPPEAAEPLLRWLSEALTLLPHLLPGFYAESSRGHLVALRKNDAIEMDLMSRWGMLATEYESLAATMTA